MSKLIVAIDGPVGSGKSTVASRVAELLGYVHLDSGAMYRGVAWKALRDGVPLDSREQLAALAEAVRIDLVPGDGKLRVILDGEDITDLIRTPEVSHAASVVAVVPGVRHPMVAEQRRAGAHRRALGRVQALHPFPAARGAGVPRALPVKRREKS